MSDTFDAVVVGAGYIGCSVAYHLCAAGLKTTLLDQGPIAAGASRANYGNIQIQDMELRKSVEMTRLARTRFATLEDELDWKIGMRKIGGLLVIENETQWKIMEERVKALNETGIHSELVPADRLKEVEPSIDTSRLMGGLYHDNEGQVDPFQLIWGYLRGARQRRLQESYYTEVIGFNIHNGRLDGIITTKGSISAGNVVLCTGAYTRDLGHLLERRWDVHYVLGQAMVTEPIDLVLKNHLASASFFEESSTVNKRKIIATFAISQSSHGHLLLGEAVYEADHFRSQVAYQTLPLAAECIQPYFPSFRKLRILRSWSAPVADCSDGCPLLGPVADVQGLYIATAFRSTVIVTPLVGETISQLITQGKSELNVNDFAPERNIAHAN